MQGSRQLPCSVGGGGETEMMKINNKNALNQCKQKILQPEKQRRSKTTQHPGTPPGPTSLAVLLCWRYLAICPGRLLFFLHKKQKKARNSGAPSGRFQNGGTLPRYMSENFTRASGSGCDAGLTPPRRSPEPPVSEVNEGQSLSAARPSWGWTAALAGGETSSPHSAGKSRARR